MKPSLFLFSFLLLPLAGCASESPWKEDAFALTAHFTPSENEGVEIYHCYIQGSNVVTYQKPDGQGGVDFSYDDWGIDSSSLIPGDAIVFENNAEKIYFADTIPSALSFYGEVRSVKIVPCALYEVKLRKVGEEISFVHQSEAEMEIALPRFKDDYALTKANGGIARKSLSSYEDGATFYYAYNDTLSRPLEFTCLYDYLPR